MMGTFVPTYDVENGYESVLDFEKCCERVVTINFPLYSSVRKLYIGLKEGAALKPAPGYRVKKPVVYYGSSITQGGCASKPGSSYESILSRRFDCDYINLGFSGNAKGEDEMTDYIVVFLVWHMRLVRYLRRYLRVNGIFLRTAT